MATIQSDGFALSMLLPAGGKSNRGRSVVVVPVAFHRHYV